MPDDNRPIGSDFDHDDPGHAKHYAERYKELREKNPRPWSENYGGFWVATKYKDVLKISQKPDTFSTHKWQAEDGKWMGGASVPTIPGLRIVPNESENPEWTSVRTFLNRRFAPKAIEEHRAKLKEWSAALVDLVIEKGEFDIVNDIAAPLPALITMEMLGFPLKDWREFSDMVHSMTHMPKKGPAFLKTVKGLNDFIEGKADEAVAARRKNPTDDLISYMANGTMDGKPLDRELILSLINQIVGGGVDTTTSLTSHALVWLARNPKDRQRLIDDPSLLPVATEEFVRFFTPVHGNGRRVKEDVDIDGWQLKEGDRIQIAWSSANRDADVFEDPDNIKIDRMPNRHIGFGMGQHRCLGSFLARLLFESMATEVLNRMPDYTLIEDTVEHYESVAFINGLVKARARFTPGKKVGAKLPY